MKKKNLDLETLQKSVFLDTSNQKNESSYIFRNRNMLSQSIEYVSFTNQKLARIKKQRLLNRFDFNPST